MPPTIMSIPVVTLLARNPGASRRAQALLRSLCHMEPVSLGPLPGKSVEMADDLDTIFNFGRFERKRCWKSSASRCPSSGTIVHFLAPSKVGSIDDDGESGELSLLSVTKSLTPDGLTDTREAVMKARAFISNHIHSSSKFGVVSLALLCIQRSLSEILAKPFAASSILGADAHPLIELPSNDGEICAYHQNAPEQPGKSSVEENTMKLREIALPYFDDMGDGETNRNSLLHTFSSSGLQRPTDPKTGLAVLGLYEWPTINGVLLLRPLPAAKEDRSIPFPSVVFQCRSLEEAENTLERDGVASAKIGFGGGGNQGQLMVLHEDFSGIDVRLCESRHSSSSFAEAQQALLAASLDELQSAHVMAEGDPVGSTPHGEKEGNRHANDAMNGMGDCWVEFRANVKRPAGFLKKARRGSSGTSVRVAKAPNLPYE